MEQAAKRLAQAQEKGAFPVVIGEDRRVTEICCSRPLVALWGKIGRDEVDEYTIFNEHPAVLAGVRAATSSAFQIIPSEVTIITAHAINSNERMLRDALGLMTAPVHLSIDFDVLTPGVVQCPRSLEPGGLSWYDMMDLTEMVFHGPGVRSVDLVGTADIAPKSTAALIGAELLIRLAALAVAGPQK